MYTIDIIGMHCSGCKNLITLSLEDEGMREVVVDEEKGYARFDSDLPRMEIERKLEKIFKELKEYSYSSLIKE